MLVPRLVEDAVDDDEEDDVGDVLDEFETLVVVEEFLLEVVAVDLIVVVEDPLLVVELVLAKLLNAILLVEKVLTVCIVKTTGNASAIPVLSLTSPTAIKR